MIFLSPEDADKHRQEHEVASHEINRLLSELSIEQLRALDFLLIGIANAGEPGRIASYMAGRSTQMLETRFNICAACNKDHAAELLKSEPVADDIPPHIEARRRMEANEIVFTAQGSKEPMTPDEVVLMMEYNLDDARDGETNALLWFVCTNCGMQYQSIQDRMLKPSGIEGCSGCIQKTKWG